VHLDGRDLAGSTAHERSRLGLGRTWQSLELFDDLTIRENLQVAAERQSVVGFLADLVRPTRPRSSDAVDEALEVVGLAALADRTPTQASQGQRKLIGVARSLAARPRVVCMDEPAAGLDSGESRALGRELRNVVDNGTSILLVDHDMGLVLEVCDRVFVIDFGRVIEAYLGSAGSSHR
jgi:branched-chain amino acid transport system ATP-binding protein